MELLLIRHGLPVRRELSEGIADPELSTAGHEQAKHLAEYLSSERIDALYSSPQQRALQTAEPIALDKGLGVEVVEDVAEWDRNASFYIPVEELKATNDPRWQAMVRGEWNVDGDTMEEFRDRVVQAVEGVVARHDGHRVAISCHGGVINAYLAHVLGLPVGQGFFYPNYTSINRVMASQRGHRSVMTINETFHLRGTGLPIGLLHT
ncbi:MAG: histidine phosphatase family protein [Actinomycetia bacterium]|nr:histidine phosphatase family protein [Actinomycetes bacterium]